MPAMVLVSATKEMSEMDIGAKEVEALVRFARAGLHTLSERVLTYVSLCACIGIFGWALYDGAWAATATACAFAVLVFWPVLKLESTRTKE